MLTSKGGALAVRLSKCKKSRWPMLGFLSREEMLAVIGTLGISWISQRDHLLLGMLHNTGARTSHITKL